jgi:nickel-dependent lactate racemase
MLKKLGSSIMDRERLSIVNHCPWLNLVHVGDTKLGTPLWVNKTYNDADVKIAIGGVVPHMLAGYGGGAKIVLPGVCGMQTLEANHASTVRTGAGAGVGIITEMRKDIEDAASIVGLDFSINVIFNSWGKMAGIFAGHYIDAHRKAIEFAQQVYST